MSDILDLLSRYAPALAGGVAVTLKLAAVVWAGGLVAGIALGVLRASLSRNAARLSSFAALAVSSVPILVYLLWAYYPLQVLLNLSLTPFQTAALVFTIYNAVIISELIRGGIDDLPVAYTLAARVNGLSRSTYYRTILFPLLSRRILPAYLASQVVALHLTLFASLISVDELFRVTQRINAIEYDAVASYSLLALFYFALSFPLFLAARWAERRLVRDGLDR